MAGMAKGYVPNNPRRSGPQQTPAQQPAPQSKQFGPGQKQPHTDGRGQSGQPRR